MKPPLKITLAVLAALLGIASISGGGKPSATCCALPFSTIAFAADAPTGDAEPVPKPAVPRLLDLGADKCIPCKMMTPILEGLKKEYSGRMNVEFIDVWKNPDAAKAHQIEIIPTQIFFDVSGKELYRHQGFFAKADILAKWKELGVDLSPKTGAP